MALLPIEDALRRVLDGAEPGGTETLSLMEAGGRVLAKPLHALRTQPPFDASAMDGYAVRAQDLTDLPARLQVIGEAPAGRPFDGSVGRGQAVRIFTGATLPAGADAIVIQENAQRAGDRIEVNEKVAPDRHIRRRGLDFAEGDLLLAPGRALDPAALSLAAAANHPQVQVIAKPLVAILATGDELLSPGSPPGPGRIIASNSFGVAAIVGTAGGRVLDLGIAPDNREQIADRLGQARSAGAQVVVTIGGASVGEHDFMRDVLTGAGVELGFWKIAMRPGKPLMFGRLQSTRYLGLPGNPVASLVCALLFLKPLVARLASLPHHPASSKAKLGAALPANDLRQDYIRAKLDPDFDGLIATPFPLQDSSMLRVLAEADALIVRPPFAPAAASGEPCEILRLR